ncbi:Predicted arabinose efflux permease, MFS family [Collimonas sp. OK607]|uniref:spinster family MFS transporter n=1 Tax=Collimonas sp. OK607 TaxID=1798194 RepID=UPI0008E3F544|nr:MFS transporter [Collimonas sp. OK607]SFA82735.1 Predicted arabinose efflux permease, MFS family [Collimonas sp. OK607]
MTAPDNPNRRSHYTLLILLFVYAMSMVDRQIMAVLIEPIKKEFGVSDTEMGLLTGLTFALFFSVVAVPFGRYADRTNRRNFIALCCGAWSLMTALCGMGTSYMQLALARGGVAVGEAGASAPSISMIADHYPPQHRARAMSVFMLGPSLGTLLGLSLGGWIAYHHGWRSAFLWMSVPGVIAALLLRFTAVEPIRGSWDVPARRPTGRTESFGKVMRDLWQSKEFKRISLAGFLLGFSGYGIGIWSTTFLVRSHGLNLKDAGIIVGVIGGVTAVAGGLFSGWLCDRLSARDPRWQLGVPILGTTIALPLGVVYFLYPAGNPWLIGSIMVPKAMIVSAMFSFFSVWWAAPSYAALTAITRSDRRATVLAVYALVVSIFGGGSGPFAVGVLSDALTGVAGVEALRWSLVGAVGIYFFAVLAFVSAMRPYKRALAAQHAESPPLAMAA